jgi:hypothetical protein
VPPVQSNSPSEASLRRDFVLSQDSTGRRPASRCRGTTFRCRAGRSAAWSRPERDRGAHRSVCRGRFGRVAAHLARHRLRLPRDAATAVKSELDAGTAAPGMP